MHKVCTSASLDESSVTPWPLSSFLPDRIHTSSLQPINQHDGHQRHQYSEGREFCSASIFEVYLPGAQLPCVPFLQSCSISYLQDLAILNFRGVFRNRSCNCKRYVVVSVLIITQSASNPIHLASVTVFLWHGVKLHVEWDLKSSA